MLEFFIALAKKMSFLMNGNDSGRHTEYYFWAMMNNLGLKKLNDDRWYYLNGDFYLEDVMSKLIDRQIDPDGKGGIFPLMNPPQDQRFVDFWYQMQAWLGENCDIDLRI